MTPIDQQSTALLYGFWAKTSGAKMPKTKRFSSTQNQMNECAFTKRKSGEERWCPKRQHVSWMGLCHMEVYTDESPHPHPRNPAFHKQWPSRHRFPPSWTGQSHWSWSLIHHGDWNKAGSQAANKKIMKVATNEYIEKRFMFSQNHTVLHHVPVSVASSAILFLLL